MTDPGTRTIDEAVETRDVEGGPSAGLGGAGEVVVIDARVVTGTDAPPTQARERPCAATLRARTTWSSSTSPPASSTAPRKPSRSRAETTPSTRACFAPERTAPESARPPIDAPAHRRDQEMARSSSATRKASSSDCMWLRRGSHSDS